MDRVESDASFIALPSDQMFDEVQPTMLPQRKRKKITPQSVTDIDNS